MNTYTASRHRQTGAANLLIALTLMLLISMGTLTVGHSHLLEARMENSTGWSNRLLTIAESEWYSAAVNLPARLPALVWQPVKTGHRQHASLPAARLSSGADIHIDVHRSTGNPHLLELRSLAQRNDGSGLQRQVRQQLRVFSVLTPAAEKAPPLIINGCISNLASITDLRPVNSDSANAGDALWQYRQARCPTAASIDVHGGQIRNRQTTARLWETVFSIDRQSFADLARQDSRLPVSTRRYWQATANDLNGGRWTLSLGTPQQPVVLYFPSTVGCPEFATGVQITGMVFIEGDCTTPIAASRATLSGTLVVDGHLNIGPAQLVIRHISLADPAQQLLALPLMRYVPVPGSWRDF